MSTSDKKPEEFYFSDESLLDGNANKNLRRLNKKSLLCLVISGLAALMSVLLILTYPKQISAPIIRDSEVKPATVIDKTVQYNLIYRPSNAFPLDVSLALFDFSFEIFGNITKIIDFQESVLISPFSLFSVFMVLMQGLRKTSLREVHSLLHFSQFSHNNVSLLASKFCQILAETNENYKLIESNGIFVDKKFQILDGFKADVSRYCKQTIKEIDFEGNPAQSREEINQFVAKKTYNEITNLLASGSIDNRTRMVLVNTLYFEAQWDNPFLVNGTKMNFFYITQDYHINVPFMHQPRAYCVHIYIAQLKTVFVNIPFKDRNANMMILMPEKAGKFELLESSDASVIIRRAIEFAFSSNRMDHCNLYFPKFTLTYNPSYLPDLFKSMGVSDIFNPNLSDFSRMTSSDGLYVSDINQKVVMEIDENGIKAAAASSIKLSTKLEYPSVVINKPFLFLVHHRKTGAILFFGRVIRPQVT